VTVLIAATADKPWEHKEATCTAASWRQQEEEAHARNLNPDVDERWRVRDEACREIGGFGIRWRRKRRKKG
jgi:hypothetical protein